MKKILIVDFNGTSSVYTHYLAKGLVNEDDEVIEAISENVLKNCTLSLRLAYGEEV